MMKTTTEKAVIAYRILNNAKLGKMKDGDKFNVVKIMKELKPVATSYDDFVKDATEKLKPEGIEGIQEKLAPIFSLPPEFQRKEIKRLLSLDEIEVWDKYNTDVAKCVQDEVAKEHEFTFVPLSEEGFQGLLASNDFSLAEILALDEVIGQ